ncbi:MAG: hypothetical protein ACRDA7_01205 [Metamycoplasmataceae bacterium]
MNKKLLFLLSSSITIAIVAPVLVITSCSSEKPVKVNLTITTKENPKLIETDIAALEGNDLPAQLTALQKLFEGADLSATNQENFSVLIDKEQKVVILTSKFGYTINGKNDLVSNIYSLEETPSLGTDLNIIAKSGSTDLTGVELIDIVGKDKAKQLIVLKKLFDNVTSEKQDNFIVSLGDQNIVTLTANKGYIFGDKASISSSKYIITNTNLIITANPKIILTADEDKKINEAQSETNAEVQLAILKKLFTGITNINAGYFSYEIANKVITLTAKTGFVFGSGSGTTTIESPAYEIDINNTDLNIQAIIPKGYLTTTDVIHLSRSVPGNKVTPLSKFFSGITIININNFTYQINEDVKTITLTAKDQFFFGIGSSAKKSITSNVFAEDFRQGQLYIWPIHPNGTISITNADLQAIKNNQDKATQLLALQKLYSGLNQNNFYNLSVFVNEINGIVTLETNYGYVFNNRGSTNPNAFLKTVNSYYKIG